MFTLCARLESAHWLKRWNSRYPNILMPLRSMWITSHTETRSVLHASWCFSTNRNTPPLPYNFNASVFNISNCTYFHFRTWPVGSKKWPCASYRLTYKKVERDICRNISVSKRTLAYALLLKKQTSELRSGGLVSAAVSKCGHFVFQSPFRYPKFVSSQD